MKEGVRPRRWHAVDSPALASSVRVWRVAEPVGGGLDEGSLFALGGAAEADVDPRLFSSDAPMCRVADRRPKPCLVVLSRSLSLRVTHTQTASAPVLSSPVSTRQSCTGAGRFFTLRSAVSISWVDMLVLLAQTGPHRMRQLGGTAFSLANDPCLFASQSHPEIGPIPRCCRIPACKAGRAATRLPP